MRLHINLPNRRVIAAISSISHTLFYPVRTLFAMAKAQLSTLPLECREQIWMLALLPGPSVYRFDPAHFRQFPDTGRFEDDRWMVPKHKYPTAMHVCQESRRLALQVIEREQKQNQDNGTLPYYCIGSSARPFNPYLDTFWFSHNDHLLHHYVMNLDLVVGNRIHTIKNLALSSCLIESAPIPNSAGHATNWTVFMWHRLGRYVSVKRVDVVFGETWVDGNGEYKSSRNDNLDEAKASVLQLGKWTEDLSSTETPDEVQLKVDRAQSDIVKGFQYIYERTRDEESGEPPLPEGAPDWQDGSEITFHAAQILKIRAS
jgi:hypothetical protein